MNMSVNHNFPAQKMVAEPMVLTIEESESFSFEVIEITPSRAQKNFLNIVRSLQKPIPAVMVDGERLENLCLSETIEECLLELKRIEARRLLAKKNVDAKKSELERLPEQYPELKKLVDSKPEEVASIIESFSRSSSTELETYTNLVNVLSDSTSEILSSRDINQMVFEAIESMTDKYLDVFQQSVEKNAAFFRDFTDFIAKLRNYIDADGDNTILKANEFLSALQDLMDDYTVPGTSTTLYPVQGSANTDSTLTGSDKEDCIAWAREMGMDPDLCVTEIKEGPDKGKYIVHIDVSPLETIKSSVTPIVDGKMTNNAAQWASWQTMMDLQKDTIQTGMQTLTQKYSNANSTFDNVVKILSSTISALLDADKAFLNF